MLPLFSIVWSPIYFVSSHLHDGVSQSLLKLSLTNAQTLIIALMTRMLFQAAMVDMRVRRYEYVSFMPEHGPHSVR